MAPLRGQDLCGLSGAKPGALLRQQIPFEVTERLEKSLRPILAQAVQSQQEACRLALNLLKRENTKKRGIKGKRLNASWAHAYLLKLLGT